jgi:hypothetical protein
LVPYAFCRSGKLTLFVSIERVADVRWIFESFICCTCFQWGIPCLCFAKPLLCSCNSEAAVEICKYMCMVPCTKNCN